MKSSPFQFLEPYSKKDTKKYHGRDHEINKLYNLLFRSNLIVVFGPSGSGKTSLIDCGLRKKLDPYEWIPITIRRNKNFNESIRRSLQDVLNEDNISDHELLVKSINSKYLVTPCLILDQFEELFVDKENDENYESRLKRKYNREEEQDQLVDLISRLALLNCKIIISIREEFLGTLSIFEERIPYFFDYKLRLVDPVDKIVDEIITKSFAQFNINREQTSVAVQEIVSASINNNDWEVPEIAADIKSALRAGSTAGKIHLPFLQIYLDRLYDHKFSEQYPDEPERTFTKSFIEEHPITFTTVDIQRLGDIRKVLLDFIETIEHELFPKIDRLNKYVHRHFIIKFLRVFTSGTGYKRPVSGEIIKGQYVITDEEINEELIQRIWGNNESDHKDDISKIIEKLIIARLLKDDGEGSFELSHDIIAGIIYEKQIDEDLFLYMKEEFESSYKTYLRRDKSKKFLLGKDQVSKFRSDITKITGEDRDKQLFWKLSREKADRSFARWFILISLLILSAVMTGFAIRNQIYSDMERERADIERDEAERQKEIADIVRDEAERQKEIAEAALIEVQEQKNIAEAALIKAEEQKNIAERARDDAEEQKEIAEAALIRAEEQTLLANEALDSARVLTERAQKSAILFQKLKEKSDSLAYEAEQRKNRGLASVLAYQSKLNENAEQRKALALKAHFVNKVYNNDEWKSDILEASMLSLTNSSGETLVSDPAEILDLIHIDHRIYYLTAAGSIKLYNLSDQKTTVLNLPDNFHFKKNSFKLEDEDKLCFLDQYDIQYCLTLDGANIRLDTIQSTSALQSLQDSLENLPFLKKRRIPWENGERITSQDQSRNLIALGTNFGRLIVYDIVNRNFSFNSQYHERGTDITDISFDSKTKLIATSGRDRDIRINRISDIENIAPVILEHDNWVNCITFIKSEENIKRFDSKLNTEIDGIKEDLLIVGTRGGKIIKYVLDPEVLAAKVCESIADSERFPSDMDQAKADSLLILACPKHFYDE